MIREHRNDNQLGRTGRIYFKQLPQSRSVVPDVLNPVTIRLISQSSPPEWTGDTLTSLYCWEFFMVIHFPYYPHKEQYTNRLWVSLSQSMKPLDVTQESEQDLPLSLSTIVLKTQLHLSSTSQSFPCPKSLHINYCRKVSIESLLPKQISHSIYHFTSPLILFRPQITQYTSIYPPATFLLVLVLY